MRALRLNGGAGMSGDMLLGLSFDLGVDPLALRNSLNFIDLCPWDFDVQRVQREGIAGTGVIVDGGEQRFPHPQLRSVMSDADIDEHLKGLALCAFDALVRAEMAVHGREDVHLHELGTLDTVVDICGVIFGLQFLGVELLSVTDLAMGSGVIPTSHGHIPNPSPVVGRLLEELKVVRALFRRERFEFTTPTAVSLMVAFEAAGMINDSLSDFTVEKVGYGAGEANPSFGPNLLQGIVGSTGSTRESEGDEVAVLSVHLDDLSGEELGGICDDVLSVGAIDAWITPVLGKKARPGYEMTVLCLVDQRTEVIHWLHERTRSPGVRYRTEHRSVLPISFDTVDVWGESVAIKSSRVSAKTEFDDLLRVQRETGRSTKEISEEAMFHWRHPPIG